jgi:hypothetical protein
MSLLIVNHAQLWNPSRSDGEAAALRAVWMQGDRVVDVTPVEAAPRPGDRSDVRVVSFPGAFVMPAFVDAHFHLLSLAHRSLRCDLSSAHSAADVVAALETSARERADEAPVVGVDFDESDWRDDSLPTRDQLDSISAQRPVYARRVCCHVGVVNTALLRRLRSSGRFVDRASGRIVENAVFEANRLTRPPAAAQVGAIDGAIAHLHSLGVTAIHDIVDPETLGVYVEGLSASSRPLRIDAYLHAPAEAFDRARDRLLPLRRRGVRAMGVKIFADGSLGGRTAALNGRYADGDGDGELLVETDALRAELEACALRSIACAVHAIGDRALHGVLDAMERVSARYPGRARFRIEHAEVIGPEEMKRCERLRVPLVMQPNFVRNWGGEDGMYASRLGRERWTRHNPFASLARANVPLVFSSDGMPAGPLFGLRGATHHANARERLSPAQAFYLYTRAAADVLGSWDEPDGDEERPAEGRIAPGARADLVVLSGNPLLADPDRLVVLATIAGGVEAFRSAAPFHSKQPR